MDKRMQLIARGMGASAGVATGSTRVVHSVNELHTLLEGEVLVVRESNPVWTVGMLRAAAIVAELGGPICHAAIVAREIGIPCVVAVEDAMRVLGTGTTITVNGSEGVIYANNS
jgi:pyruvate, water dikinase